MSQDNLNVGDIPTKFVETPSPHLKCPICGGIYKDPVINIKCGHTFCRVCVFATTHCPVDDSHCDTSQVVVNRLVVGQIEDLLIYCRHSLIKNKDGAWDLATDSCQQIISIGKRHEHEDMCLFALVRCPYSEKCAQMRKKDLEQHKKFCNQVECKYVHKGLSSYRSSSAIPQRSSSPGRNYEKWEMPFQFKCIGTLRGHKDVVWAMITRKGHLYSAGADGIIKIWSLEQLAKGCVGNIAAHNGVIHCLATWGNTLISAGADKSINIWDLDTCQKKSTIASAHENIICSMTVCDNWLFTSSFGIVKVWDLKTMQLKTSLQSENHWVRALAVGRGKATFSKMLGRGVEKSNCHATVSQVSSFQVDIGQAVFDLMGNLADGNYEQNIQVFSTETHEFVMNFCGHIGTVTTLVISPSGQFLFSASHDSTIQMWGLEKMLPIQNLSRHQGSVNTLTLHGDFLLSGSEDHEVKVGAQF
ncbi:E3 ubiquitin-protein ligase TRAF7-like [Elysia marginata]|uniref:E3 ubiquitin-protein ligase TRAF7-like n=1 Tax=Elysia marginata TaxID=1093978 RepID=A0AAV4G8T5_9GAST|nr:E3 ubiquitin-protein ligase TRAF7-like [Elysia marginata]